MYFQKIPETDIILSPLGPEDKKEIAPFFAVARMAEDNALIPGYIESAVKENYFEKALQRYFEGAFTPSTALQARLKNGGALVGFVMVGQADPDYQDEIKPFLSEGVCGELHWLYVRPDLKRKGIGSLLFRRAVSELCSLGYDRLVVNMLEAKPATQKFYEAMGVNLLAPRLEFNKRNGTVYRVPCLLLGHEDLLGLDAKISKRGEAACLLPRVLAPAHDCSMR